MMEYLIKQIIEPGQINIYNTIIRLLLSFLIGAIIGFEREKKQQPAGLRTHTIICLGSTLLMILSIYIPQEFINFKNGDPGRIAAQVITGIGFLGAGAIIRLGFDIKGLTTAATIWVVSGIGLTIGAGLYYAAFTCVIILLFSLIIVNKIEKMIFPILMVKTLEIFQKTEKVKIDIFIDLLEKYNIATKNIEISQSIEEKSIKIKLLIQAVREDLDYVKLYNEIKKIKGVRKVNLLQKLK